MEWERNAYESKLSTCIYIHSFDGSVHRECEYFIIMVIKLFVPNISSLYFRSGRSLDESITNTHTHNDSKPDDEKTENP